MITDKALRTGPGAIESTIQLLVIIVILDRSGANRKCEEISLGRNVELVDCTHQRRQPHTSMNITKMPSHSLQWVKLTMLR